MSIEINIQSPTRVDLAGGTLDCWPLYLFLHDPVTVNLSIDIFTRVKLRPVTDGSMRVRLITKDLQLDREYANLEDCLRDTDPAFDLIRVVLGHYRTKLGSRGFSIETASESPVGGGLGGSSSLCISILKALGQWLEVSYSETDLVRLASHLEARLLLKPTGTQDYFPPIESGLCFITYGAEGPVCRRERIDPQFFKERFTLIYTGRSHHSGINNWQVIKDWLDGDMRTRSAMSELAIISKEVAQAILELDAKRLARLFAKEFAARVRLSSGFSSPEIEKIHAIALKHQSVAKICGAGGGGCVFVWSPEGDAEQRLSLMNEITAGSACRVLPAQPYFETGSAH